MSLATGGIHCTIMSASFSCSIGPSPGHSGAGSSERSVAKIAVSLCPRHYAFRLAVERSRRSRASATRRQSSATYGGEMPASDWRTTGGVGLISDC